MGWNQMPAHINPSPEKIILLIKAGVLNAYSGEKLFFNAHIRNTLGHMDGRMTLPRLQQLMAIGIIDVQDYNKWAPSVMTGMF